MNNHSHQNCTEILLTWVRSSPCMYSCIASSNNFQKRQSTICNCCWENWVKAPDYKCLVMLGRLGYQMWDYYSCQARNHERTLYYCSFRSTCILNGHSNAIPKDCVIAPALNVVQGERNMTKCYLCVLFTILFYKQQKSFLVPNIGWNISCSSNSGDS